MVELWREIAARAGVMLSEEQIDALRRYLDRLLEANRRMNLTRIADRAAAEVRHVADALTVLPYLPAGECSLADVGSGGGVPGIPLAIVRPDAQVMLIESTRKKAAFLREAAGRLRLANVQVLDQRAEEVARSDLCESFDVAVARAVGELAWLAEWCLPLVKKGGKVLAMKGARAGEELAGAERAIHRLSGGQPIVHPVDLEGTEHHVIVEIPKLGRTPPQYPRHPTLAKGKPLS